jgi:hypothetical protein
VSQLFQENGYQLEATNVYDGRGGDADILLLMRIPMISDLIDAVIKVYVQVKQKTGTDCNDREGIEQLVTISRLEVNSIKILVSTVDAFSSDTKALAEEHSVNLINGLDLARLMAKYL